MKNNFNDVFKDPLTAGELLILVGHNVSKLTDAEYQQIGAQDK